MALATAQKNREMFAIKKSYSIEVGYHLDCAYGIIEVGCGFGSTIQKTNEIFSNGKIIKATNSFTCNFK